MDPGEATPPPLPADPEYRKALEAQDWGAIMKELVSFASWKARKKGWAAATEKGRSSMLPGGRTFEDVAQEAIELVWVGEEGKRRWDMQGSLLDHLKGAVSSILSNTYTSSEKKRASAARPEDQDGTASNEFDSDGISEVIVPTHNQNGSSDPANDLERTESADRLYSDLVDAIDGDPQLEKLFGLWTADMPARECAKELGVSHQEIYTLNRKLERRLGPLKQRVLRERGVVMRRDSGSSPRSNEGGERGPDREAGGAASSSG